MATNVTSNVESFNLTSDYKHMYAVVTNEIDSTESVRVFCSCHTYGDLGQRVESQDAARDAREAHIDVILASR